MPRTPVNPSSLAAMLHEQCCQWCDTPHADLCRFHPEQAAISADVRKEIAMWTERAIQIIEFIRLNGGVRGAL